MRLQPSAATTDVERRLRDRSLALAAANADHFIYGDGAAGNSPAPCGCCPRTSFRPW